MKLDRLPAAMFYLALAVPLPAQTVRYTLRKFPPAVPNAGRTNGVAVDASGGATVIVASDSGGFFRSTNGGRNFTHMMALRHYMAGR